MTRNGKRRYHDAWNTLIVKGSTKGTHKLADEPT
jgi:hypothetical protein